MSVCDWSSEVCSSDPSLTYQITAGSLVSGDGFSGGLVRAAGESVGLYDITQGSLSAGGNYDLSFHGAKLEMTRGPIEVPADAQTKVYGHADPSLTYQITAGSLVSGDGFRSEERRVGEESVGRCEMNQGSLSAGGNYDLSFHGAKLEITKRPIEVTADAHTKDEG